MGSWCESDHAHLLRPHGIEFGGFATKFERHNVCLASVFAVYI